MSASSDPSATSPVRALHALDVDADVASARTLPASFYTDRAVHERVLERVFASGWHYVGDATEAPRSGDLVPRTLLPGALDEPLLLARGDDGELRILSNVCTHRGKVLVEEPCTRKSILCDYHGRRFALDGAFQSAPSFEGARDFPRAEDSLARLASARIGPLVFTSIAPRASFDAVFGPLLARLAWLPFDELEHDPSRDRTFEFDAHWALYCDNFLEGLHIPFVHPALNKTLDFGGYATELERSSSLQIGIAAPGESAFEPPASSSDHGKRVAGYYALVHPTTMLNFYPWGLSLNVVEPQGLARTRVRFRAYVWDRSKLDRGAGSGLDTVELEDEAAVTSVQRGVRSRLYRTGRYSPSHETAVHHFHRFLAAALA